MATQLFGRRFSLIVGNKKIEGGGDSGPGLRVAFRVSKSIGKNPNTALIQIFNLSRDTREAMKHGQALVLEAGYKDTIASIFSGTVRHVSSELQGPTWVTKIQSGDGEKSYNVSRFAKSYSKNVSVTTIVKDAIAATSLNPGNVDAAFAETPRGNLTTFSRGYVAHGRAIETIYALAKSVGLTVSIQGGTFQFLRNGAAPGQAVLISSGTGMIGSPVFSSAKTDKGPGRVLAKSLLQPSIICGGQVKVQSEIVTGAFRVEKLEHVGDNYGQDWETSLELTVIK